MARKADYLACAARGLTQAETARELGVSEAAVSGAVRHYGLTFAPYRPGAKYAALAAEGLTVTEAAKRLGVTKAAVCSAALRHGLKFARRRPAVDRLTDREREDYVFLVYRKRYRKAEALRVIGRADLVANG